jgi:E3 ubiquitin-protein ligase CCNP1IP1
LSKGLTEKYSTLNTEKEKVINSASTEILGLQSKIAGSFFCSAFLHGISDLQTPTDMQLTQDQLQKKNEELISLYQEKCKKHTQMTNLYNLLKGRALRSQIQTAASDSVSQTLKSLPHAGNVRPGGSMMPQTATAASRHFNALSSTEKPALDNSRERLFRHQRSGSASSKSKEGRLTADAMGMPPPQFPFSGNLSKACICLRILFNYIEPGHSCLLISSFPKPTTHAVASSYASSRIGCPRKIRTAGRTSVHFESWAIQRFQL